MKSQKFGVSGSKSLLSMGRMLRKLAAYYRQLERELKKAGKYRFVDEQHGGTEQENVTETAT